MGAFTYNGTLDSDLERVRFYLGDTVNAAGPRPEDANFTDAEILGLIAVEGSWQRAVAAGFESLAASWAKHVTFASGMRTGANISDIAAAYAAQAKDWRLRFGTPNQHVVGSHRVTREDAYSTDLDNVSRDFPGL